MSDGALISALLVLVLITALGLWVAWRKDPAELEERPTRMATPEDIEALEDYREKHSGVRGD